MDKVKRDDSQTYHAKLFIIMTRRKLDTLKIAAGIPTTDAFQPVGARDIRPPAVPGAVFVGSRACSAILPRRPGSLERSPAATTTNRRYIGPIYFGARLSAASRLTCSMPRLCPLHHGRLKPALDSWSAVPSASMKLLLAETRAFFPAAGQDVPQLSSGMAWRTNPELNSAARSGALSSATDLASMSNFRHEPSAFQF